MDRAPKEGSDWFEGCHHLFRRRNNRNLAFVVTWNEVEGKFSITCRDLSVQRSSGGSNEEMEAASSATASLAATRAAAAITEAIMEAVAGAVADTRNSHDSSGDLAPIPPAAQPSGPAHSAHPRGDSTFPTGAEGRLPKGATMWSQILSPASKLAEVRNGCNPAAAASNDASVLDDPEMSEMEILNDDDEATTIFKLWRPEEEEDLEDSDPESCMELELELELYSEPQDLEDAAMPLVVTVSEDGEEAVIAETRRSSSWTSLFSFQDLRAAHQRLSAVSSELEPWLPTFPDEPAGSQRNFHGLCSQLQVYLNYALETCGWKILCQVLFKEAAEPSEQSETSVPLDELRNHLPRDRSIVYVMAPIQGPRCDDNPDSKKDPGSDGGPSGGRDGAGF